MGRPQGDPQMFTRDQVVRYRPGQGTYGYEDGIDADGRIPAVVIGHTSTMVRIRFEVGGRFRPRRVITRCVAAASLIAVA